ncbi:MAG: hypothetical protein CMJ35_12965 [Phycisphaerae bacterium]|jgi:RNA polymerase sigma factor (sigma-70 family)|nr:hypothetical protein [Phycisphaerae bacterium]MBM92504.1 hypothetical protein [Phycisphaerae bacterium]
MGNNHFDVFHPSVTKVIHIKAHRLCQRPDHSCTDREELEQRMRIHLWQKRDRFNPARGNPCAFANAALKHWCAQYLRDRSRLKRDIHRTRPIEVLGSDAQVDRSWRQANERFDAKELMHRCLQILSPEELAFLRLVSELGERRTADELGITRHIVRQRRGLIRAKCEKLDDFGDNPDRS